MLSYLFIFNSLNLILSAFSAKLNSLNHHSLTNYSVFSLFLRAASEQSSSFDLIMFRECTFIELNLTSCFVVDLSF